MSVSRSSPSVLARLSVAGAFLAAGLVVVLGTVGVVDLPGDPVELAAPLFAAGCAGVASLHLRAGRRARALAAAACAVGAFLAFAGETALSLVGVGLLAIGGGGLLVGSVRDRRSARGP